MGQGHKFSGGGSNSGLGTKGGKIIQQKEIKSLLDKDPLLKDLVNSGVKISPKDVVFAAKDKSGQTVWLEKAMIPPDYSIFKSILINLLQSTIFRQNI